MTPLDWLSKTGQRVSTLSRQTPLLSVRLILASCVACVVSASAPQERVDVAASAEAVRTALDAGHYVDADHLASGLVKRFEGEYGRESIEAARASDRLVEALLRNGKAGAADTLTLSERVVRLKERLLGREDADLAVSLDNLGAVHTDRGEMMAALPLHERALVIRRRALGPGDSAVADTLDRLALPLILLQRFRNAEQALEESQRVRDSGSNQSQLALARTLYLVAILHRYDGRYAMSTSPLARALEIRRRLLPADHPDIGATFQLRGELNFLEGKVDAAQNDWSIALAIAERTLRLGHPDIALSLRWLALAAKAFGDLATARLQLERALPIGQQSLGPCHQEIPGLLNDFASLIAYEGDYAQAQKLYATALATRERCLGPIDQRTATVVHNQALLAAEMGDLAQAEQLHRRAIRMWSLGLGPNHPYVARGLDALAEVVAARRQPAKALELYEKALAIRRRTLGADHPDVAWTLTNIAQVTGASGKAQLAVKRLDQAIDIYQRIGAGDEPDHLSKAFALRGSLEARLGDFQAAHASFDEALAMRERIFGATHPLFAASRADVGAADLALGAPDLALSAGLDAERIGRDQLRFTIRYLPERQAMAYAAKRPRGLDLALSVIAAGKVPEPSSVIDAVIQSRGVILDELAARAQSFVGSDPELASLNASVTASRARFANLMLRSVEGQDPVPRTLLEETRQHKEDAERALAEKSVTSRGDLASAHAGLDEVRRAIPPGSVLVSFVRYDRTSFATNQGRTVAHVTPSYIAFVIPTVGNALTVVPLGAAALLESRVDAWRHEVDGHSVAGRAPEEAERAYRTAGVRLRQRVWDPFAGLLSGATRVFIVPDGSLNLVSLAALPSGADRYLVETGPVIHLLSTERDLIPGVATRIGHGLLAVGGPAYDLQTPSPARKDVSRSGCGSAGLLRFEDLPGSRAEVQDIARIWSREPAGGSAKSASNDDVTVLSGRAASKKAVARAAAGRRVVHLATHGFFLGSPCVPAPGNTRGVGGLASALSFPSVVADSPLLLAGLAFAGANTRPATRDGQHDGILTGEEVAALNLQGTEWAVLSACDTGLGEIRTSEGVFGLRRAFQIAGARTVIMSLWSVDDDATRLWMRALYEGRLQKRLSTADAIQQASLTALRDRRAHGQSTHPFYWAGFVAAGDWR